MLRVQQSWKRIAAWYRANAPAEDFFLASGAAEEEIERVEAEVGIRLPNDVRRSYELHNGSDHHAIFEYGFHMLSLDEIVKQWSMWRDHFECGIFEGMHPNPHGPIKMVWWDLKWIPITHNAGGDHHCVDLDPDVGGTKGQVIKFSHEPGPQRVVAPSLQAWLAEFAAGLENGKYRFDQVEHWLVPLDAE